MLPNTVVIVGEAIAGESAKVREELKRLAGLLETTAFDISDLLWKVKKNHWYQPDFETFKEFYESIGLKRSKAEYLTDIAEVMEQVNIGRNTYEPLGTSKLREICSLDPNSTWTNPETNEVTPMKEFITELVDKGKELKYDDIKQHVKTLKGQVGDDEYINKMYGWTRGDYRDIIEPAEELARKNIGSVGKDENGMAIDASSSYCHKVWAQEYLADPNNNVIKDAVVDTNIVEGEYL